MGCRETRSPANNGQRYLRGRHGIDRSQSSWRTRPATLLPVSQWSQCPPHCEHRKDQRRPSLDFRRRVSEPAKNFYFVKMMTMNKEGYGSIDPKIADQHRRQTYRDGDRAAPE